MSRDLAQALRRDDLWLDAELPLQLLCSVGPSRQNDIVLLELASGELVQALVVKDVDGDLRVGFVPLVLGPVREGAR